MTNKLFNKKFFAVLFALVFACTALTGCSSSDSNSGQTNTDSDEPIHIKVGVTGAVHEIIWGPAIEALKDEGIEIEMVQFSDYTQPNKALADGDIDLDAFQHLLYLNNEIAEHGYEITKIANEYKTYLNLFSNKLDSIDQLGNGDKIAIPNDVTNGGAALLVLEQAGIINLRDDLEGLPTVDDIVSYNYDVQIIELASNIIPASLDDVAAGMVNANYAVDYGFKLEDALYVGDLNEPDRWTLIAARTADLQDPEKVAIYDKIVKAVQSEATKQAFKEDLGGYYDAAGWDEDLLAEYR
jgi:D-methionine transport system substrate-binding protein